MATSRPLPPRRRSNRGAARRPATYLAITALAAGACARAPRAPTRLALATPFAADSQSARVVAPGIVQRSLYVRGGPWAIHLLDVDRSRCWSLAATKGADAAAGRTGTLALARALDAVGAVNADFFTLTAPTGVPQSLHVEHGVVVTGPSPSARPSLVVGADGAPRIASVRVRGHVATGADTLPIVSWNRAAPAAAGGLALYDRGYGTRTDSAPNRLFVRLGPAGGPRAAHAVLALDSGAVATIGDGELLLATPPGGAVWSARLRTLATAAAPVDVTIALDPPGIAEAVSGFPILARDGAMAADVDTSGAASFRARNPRTAVGLTARGHVLLAVVDGRQPGYSDGMTMRELAALMLALGARDALNLDGGGSSTLVARDAAGALGIVNRPSDKGGERPVGNALAVRACGTRGARR